MNKKPRFIRRPTTIIIGIIVIVGAGYVLFSNKKKAPLETIAVARATITQEVSVTGQTKPAHDVELTFEKSGRVSRTYVEVGDTVKAGRTLVELERSELSASLLEAQANLDAQQAKLDELKRGTRSEELQVQEAQVDEAMLALEDAQKALRVSIRDAYTKTDDAVRNKVDQFFDKPQSADPQVTFVVSNSKVETDLEKQRALIEPVLVAWNGKLETISYADTRQNLATAQTLLDNAALALNSLSPAGTLTQTTIDKYRSDVATARANVNTALSNLASVEEKRRSSDAARAVAEKELILKQSGSTPEEIAAQDAQVKQALAKVRGVQAQIDKTILRSPIEGIITKQDAKTGEIVSPNIPLVFVISSGKYAIEANISEVDIAKIKIGNAATLTLDAYGPDETFAAQVAKIDPAETIVEGVTTYKTTLQFTEDDARIKPSMTANIEILTDEKENVLVVPQRAVYAKNGLKFVRLIKNNAPQEREVKTGIRGSDGNIEILEGLAENDEIAASINQ